MKIKLTTNKFNEDQLRDYMKIKFKYRDEWLGLLIARIRSYYLSYDKERAYDFITCDDIPFALLDIDSSIVKDIDNDKYDYYVLCGESERDLMDELNMCLKEFPNKIIKLIENRFSETTSYTSAIYDKETETMNLTNTIIYDELYKYTIFRFNKETKITDRIQSLKTFGKLVILPI